MTLKEQILKARKKNPSFGYHRIATLVGCSYNTVRFHVDGAYKVAVGVNRRTNRINKKKRLVECFGGKCIRCGYDKCLRALDFHHADPSAKEIELHAARSLSFDTMFEEAKKCILVCRNCHAEIHDEIDAAEE